MEGGRRESKKEGEGKKGGKGKETKEKEGKKKEKIHYLRPFYIQIQ